MMTEADWLASVDPEPLVEFVLKSVTHRKLRLLGVAICCRIRHLLTDQSSLNAIDVVERFADGLANDTDLDTAISSAFTVFQNSKPAGVAWDLAAPYSAGASLANAVYHLVTPDAAAWVAGFAATGRAYQASAYGEPAWEVECWTETLHQAELARDIFGNPFRPAGVDPAWFTWDSGAIPKLAQAIYEERTFDRMPALADALMAAGCTNDDILAHCRSGGEHVRGCWVIDLLLGKE
jgi:hypothetical protein